MDKVLDTPYVYYQLDGDLLTATYKKDVKVNLEMAREIIRERHMFTDYKPVVLLVYNQGVVKMDKKARELLASGDGVKGIIAAAIVVGSPFTSFMANFFVSVNKPIMPVRVFSDEEGAMKWLQKYRK